MRLVPRTPIIYDFHTSIDLPDVVHHVSLPRSSNYYHFGGLAIDASFEVSADKDMLYKTTTLVFKRLKDANLLKEFYDLHNDTVIKYSSSMQEAFNDMGNDAVSNYADKALLIRLDKRTWISAEPNNYSILLTLDANDEINYIFTKTGYKHLYMCKIGKENENGI